MNMVSKVPEEQHDNVKAGQTVKVKFDAIPGTTFEGTVKNVGGITAGFFFNPDSSHTFDVTIELNQSDSRLRPGLTAAIVYEGAHANRALYIPRQSLFMKDGKRVVFVRKGRSYQQREVKIDSESESRAVIDGIDEGSVVALLDPTAPRKRTGSAGGNTKGAP